MGNKVMLEHCIERRLLFHEADPAGIAQFHLRKGTFSRPRSSGQANSSMLEAKKRPCSFIVAALYLLACLLSYALTGRTAESALLDRVRLGTSSKSLDPAPFWFGRQKGSYRDGGIDLEIVVARTTVIRMAVASGDLDYATPVGSFLALASKGMPMKLVFFASSR
jgi:hypothetical protein